jgi:hypothetical protein
LYAFTFNKFLSEDVLPHRALLLYPGNSKQPELLRVAVRNISGLPLGEIWVIGVAIPALLQELRSGNSGRVFNFLLNQINTLLSLTGKAALEA